MLKSKLPIFSISISPRQLSRITNEGDDLHVNELSKIGDIDWALGNVDYLLYTLTKIGSDDGYSTRISMIGSNVEEYDLYTISHVGRVG